MSWAVAARAQILGELRPAVALRVITGNVRRHPAAPAPAGNETGPRITEVPKSLSSP
jgi:hypothetical protein